LATADLMRFGFQTGAAAPGAGVIQWQLDLDVALFAAEADAADIGSRYRPAWFDRHSVPPEGRDRILRLLGGDAGRLPIQVKWPPCSDYCAAAGHRPKFS